MACKAFREEKFEFHSPSSLLLMIFIDKFYQGVIHLFRMGGAQEMLAVFDYCQLRIWRIDKHLYLSLRVFHGVHYVSRPLSHDQN